MNIPTAVIIPEGYTTRVIDNYAGDHDVAVKPGRYELTPEYRIERAAWTRSGEDERRLVQITASLTICEPERTVATALYAGRAIARKVEPAHEATKTLRIEPQHLADLARFFPALTFEYAEVEPLTMLVERTRRDERSLIEGEMFARLGSSSGAQIEIGVTKALRTLYLKVERPDGTSTIETVHMPHLAAEWASQVEGAR